MSLTTYTDFAEKLRFDIYPELLDVIKREGKFQIFQGITPLLTPAGKEMKHDSERLIHLIITDMIFQGHREVERFSAPVLFAFQKDVVESADDAFRLEWDAQVLSDPFVIIKTTGKNNTEPFRPEDKLFSFAFITVSALIKSINDFVNTAMSETDLQDSELHPFPELLRWGYDRLSAEQKVVVQAVNGVHGSGLVLPLVLILGIISPNEYAKGLVALKIKPESDYESIMLDATRVLDYLACYHQEADTVPQIGQKIREGENELIEFKSTLRWDIRAGKTNQAVERACLKTISAFLNSQGGTLLIGVRDDGTIEGIETDKFVNEDKFLLHLWTLIRTCLGRDVSRYIRTQLEKTDEKTVCIVHCLRSHRPVFLRQPGFDEEFFIRVGPSSNAMDISEALRYIGDHFENS